ncbi:uncharacterized protein [Spinacia oleracea]|uniref:Reverse transcriptase domain-containing protein n=1 Tax=Spinacia oleracea TaxID=3562 RepID=A0ABM3R8V2_SPIOL|nr:uncharacterized protein LOC130467535 [Spinacia oleracea]
MYNKYRDPKKYCDFHRDHGHLTEECTHLKDNIEDLIRRGYLTQFKAKNSYSRTYENRDNDSKFESKRVDHKQSQPTDQKRPGDILVIKGGPVYAGTTTSGAKASVNEFRHQVNYHNAGKWPAPPRIPHCTFTEDDCKDIIYPHDGPMVLALNVANRKIHRILIDGGSSANILFWPAFQELQIDDNHIKPVNYPVICFTWVSVVPEGIVSLPVQVGQGRDIKDVMVDFMIVKVPAAYNAILGRPFIHDAGAVVSTYHLTMIPPPLIEEELPQSRKRKREERKRDTRLSMENFEHREEGLLKPTPAEETEEIELEEGVKDRTKRSFSAENNVAIQEEVNKLLAAKFIEECDYLEWLANVVMVKKANGQWRMCVDFTDLNRACPKDCYPLPGIDQLISLLESDRKKAAFITEAGVYNYKAMPFGLKNDGATYQKLVDKIFAGKKGRNVKVYVDDSIVKSKKGSDHVEDLRETFATLRRYGIKLNPKKCVFGVKSGKFLGFLVSERGIDANLEKVEAILNLPEPKSIH